MGLLEVEILGIKKGTTGEIVISELRKITQLWKHFSLSTELYYSDYK